MGALTDIVLKSKESNSTPPVTLCKVTVPLLLGLCRSVGRYATSNPPLLCRLYPRPAKPLIRSNDPNHQLNLSEACKNTYYTHFRPIIPRSMSGSLNAESVDSQVEKTGVKKNHLICFYSVPYDPTTHFFTKFGSSFNQFPNMRTYEHYSNMDDDDENPRKLKTKVPFPVNHLQRIFDLSKKLLTKELLQHLDEQAEDIFQLNLVSNASRYGYKSFSETITLVIVTLLREILQNQNGEIFL